MQGASLAAAIERVGQGVRERGLLEIADAAFQPSIGRKRSMASASTAGSRQKQMR